MAGNKPFLFNDPLPVTLAGSVATGLYHNAAVSNLVMVKTGPTGVYGGFVSNPSQTAMIYLQCFDAASVSAVNLGQTLPQDTFHVPPLSAFGDKWSNSVTYNNGIVIAATTDLGNGTVSTTALKVSLYII